MNCPVCEAESKVLETRGNKRRRECLGCNIRWSTLEVMQGIPQQRRILKKKSTDNRSWIEKLEEKLK